MKTSQLYLSCITGIISFQMFTTSATGQITATPPDLFDESQTITTVDTSIFSNIKRGRTVYLNSNTLSDLRAGQQTDKIRMRYNQSEPQVRARSVNTKIEPCSYRMDQLFLSMVRSYWATRWTSRF